MIQTLKDTISEVIAEMCFMYEETEPEQIQENYSWYVMVDDSKFSIYLYFDEENTQEITANFLGIGDKPAVADQQDTLKEILNMIIGRFIGEVYPDHADLLPIPVCQQKPFNLPEHGADNEFFLYYNQKPLKIVFLNK